MNRLNVHDFIAFAALVLFVGWFTWFACVRRPKHEQLSSKWKPPEGDRDGR